MSPAPPGESGAIDTFTREAGFEPCSSTTIQPLKLAGVGVLSIVSEIAQNATAATVPSKKKNTSGDEGRLNGYSSSHETRAAPLAALCGCLPLVCGRLW
ncbi:MAG: hypothetical protein WA687_13250 [Solirubrobacterales bacterium]